VTTIDIRQADMESLFDSLTDESVDFFFTDPPYSRKFIHLYGRLARLAQAKLKPGGLCFAYAGHANLPAVFSEMQAHMTYVWTACLWQQKPTGTVNAHGRLVHIVWKPVVVFMRQGPTPRTMLSFTDAQISPASQKTHHAWEQSMDPALRWIARLTNPGNLVVDPFCGGGTTAAACFALGRRCITTDIDPVAVETARRRLVDMARPGLEERW
jgi:DNA modification methylase